MKGEVRIAELNARDNAILLLKDINASNPTLDFNNILKLAIEKCELITSGNAIMEGLDYEDVLRIKIEHESILYFLNSL